MMNRSILRVSRLLDAVQMGLAFGVVMTALFFTGLWLGLDFCGLIHSLNAPAIWMAKAWDKAGLPPHGSPAVGLVPPVMMLVQWSFVGILLGLRTAWKTRRNIGKNEEATWVAYA
jgi:hypothetical protein